MKPHYHPAVVRDGRLVTYRAYEKRTHEAAMKSARKLAASTGYVPASVACHGSCNNTIKLRKKVG